MTLRGVRFVDNGEEAGVLEIQDAIVARLSDQISYLKTCRDYQGDYDNILEDDAVRARVIPLCPAALVIWMGETPEPLSSTKVKMRRSFDVLIAVKNLRGERETRAGTATEEGAYKLCRDVRNALFMQSLGLDMDPIRAGGAISVLPPTSQGAGLAIYSVKISTAVVVGIPTPASAVEMDGIDSKYFPPEGPGTAEDPDVEGRVDFEEEET